MDSTAVDSSESSDELESVDVLASDFLARFRDGERPTVDEYVRRHPELGDPIRRMFPLIASVERMKVNKQTSVDGTATLAGHSINQLDDYRIIREIGRGGMGIVFEAEQESLGRRVAVKVLPKQSLLDDESLERFRREARTAAAMHHSNIVPIYGSGEADGSHYLVMQLVRGESLDTVLNNSEVDISITEATQIGMQVADAIAYAHTAGVLHRDIKPANILLEADGTAQITDFGLAKDLGDDATVTRTLSGSLRYMAPERFSGVSDERCDVYSLGLTLYELLTRRPAFAESQPEPLIRAITHQRIQPIRSFRSDVPIDVETVVMKAISADPNARYQSAAELRDDMGRFMADQPILARRISPLAKCWRWCRRNRSLATAIAITTMTLLTATAVSSLAYWQTSRSNRIAISALETSETTASLALESLDGIVEMVSVPSAVVDLGLAGDSTPDVVTGLADVSLYVSASELAILERIQPLYQRLAQQSPTRSDIVLQMMGASVQLARIQYQLGDPSKAIETLQRAVVILESRGVTAKVPKDKIHLHLARLNNELGIASTAALNFSDADTYHVAAVKAAELIAISNIAGQTELARAHLLLGDFAAPRRRMMASTDGQRQEQLGQLDRAIQILQQTLLVNQPATRILHARALLAKSRLVGMAEQQEFYLAGLEMIRSQLAKSPDNASIRFELVQALSDVDARRQRTRPRSAAAKDRLQEALKELQPLRTMHPATPVFAVAEVHLRHKLSSLARVAERFAEAQQQLESAVEIQTTLLSSVPESTTYRCWRALLYRSQSELAFQRGDAEAAQAAIELAISELDTIEAAASSHPFYLRTKRLITAQHGRMRGGSTTD